ncbi:UDP-glucose 4-epimerase family protein [Legionella maceachernii]|uniref:UDP-glucose 4-epimerase n=1 Tax=Legionella maceachernii TaxID=466 RepID=A0A0W0WCR8_9GAMM|nr:SDR family oxidoreductase [Legionella maceachernii]KTD30165.1 UDP-glucose 4-epimerase [Legionella maceachernii]SJZ93229.1 Nucleoside-diphosphate-sugar epimerase [Legionella maceachernii]SUP03464.1 Cholesterol dehydrogenase [Legionella maceachernii]
MLNGHILLTGATGFVGRPLVKRLINDTKASLKLAIRSSTEQFTNPRITVFAPIDISGSTDWSTVLKDCEVIIHMAARAHVLNETAEDPISEFRKVNTEGTLNLARQAAQYGVKRFIFLSSIGVNGNETVRDQVFSANDLPNPSNPYALSKHEAEQGLQRLAEETQMEVVIIRPPLIYGVGAKGNFHRLIQWLQKGVPLPLGAINNKRSFVAITNLLSLIMRCIDHPAAANQVFLVSDGEDLSTTALLRKISQILKLPARLLPIPQRLLAPIATLLGRKADLQRLCGSLQIDISKTCATLEWEPEVTMDEALRLMLDQKHNE